jgi:hypothetical protein
MNPGEGPAWPIEFPMPTLFGLGWVTTLWRGERGWWRTCLHLGLLGFVFALASLIHPITVLVHRVTPVPAAFSLKCLLSSSLNGWRHRPRFRAAYGLGIALVAIGFLGFLFGLWAFAQGLMLLYR